MSTLLPSVLLVVLQAPPANPEVPDDQDWGAATTVDTPATEPAAPSDDEVSYDDLHELLAEDIVTGASKSQERSSDAPGTTYSLTGAQLEAYGVRTFREAFNFLALGVHWEAQGSSGTQTVGARGMAFAGDAGNHFLMVVDGHYINDPQRGVSAPDTILAIPIEAIDRIELILGPGSVLYGSNAMLGVINVVTKPGGDVDGVRTYVERGVAPPQSRAGDLQLTRWGDRGTSTRTGVVAGREFRWGRQRGDVLGQAEFINHSDASYEVGPQFIPGTEDIFDWGEGSGNTRVWGGLSESSARSYSAYGRFNLGGFQLSGRSSIVGRRSPHLTGNINDPSDSYLNGIHHTDARYTFNLHRRVTGTVRGYWDISRTINDVTLHFVPACDLSPAPCRQTQDTQGWRLGGEASVDADWFGDGRFASLVGADVAHVDAFGKLDVSVNGERYDTAAVWDVSQLRVGTYVQQRALITPRFRANAGLRWDLQGSQSAFSPRAAAVVDAWQGGTLKLVYSQAFRAPSLHERFNEYPNARLPAPELDPEKVRGLELSASQRRGPHSVVVSTFGTWWRDMILDAIVNDPDRLANAKFEQKANLGTIFNVGLNAGYRLDLGPWMAHANANYAWARVDLGDDLSDDSQNADFEERATSRIAWERHGKFQPLKSAPAWWANLGTAYTFSNGATLGVASWVHGPRYIRDVYQNNLLRGALDDGASATVPARARLRLHVGGPIPKLPGFRIDLTGSVITNVQNSSVIGPLGAYHVGDGTTAIDHDQSPRLRVRLRLMYEF